MATVLCIGGESVHTRHPLLKSAGFNVLTATNESDLLAAGRSAKIDAVILDSRSAMSNLPGLASELKRVRPSLRIVLVTDAGLEDAPEPLAAFDRVLSRLDGPVALLGTLRELTSSMAATKQSAHQTRSQSRKLRQEMSELRHKIHRLREMLSKDKFNTKQ